MAEEKKELTYGERAVGLNFNPGNNPDVQDVKEMYGDIIDRLHNMKTPEQSERNRLISIAITEAQTAQMWAVKAITFNN